MSIRLFQHIFTIYFIAYKNAPPPPVSPHLVPGVDVFLSVIAGPHTGHIRPDEPPTMYVDDHSRAKHGGQPVWNGPRPGYGNRRQLLVRQPRDWLCRLGWLLGLRCSGGHSWMVWMRKSCRQENCMRWLFSLLDIVDIGLELGHSAEYSAN